MNIRDIHDPGHILPGDTDPKPDRHIPISETLIRSTIESLEQIEEFFQHYASPSLHENLRAYAQAHGWHPLTGPGAFLDAIAFTAHTLNLALNDRKENGTSLP